MSPHLLDASAVGMLALGAAAAVTALRVRARRQGQAGTWLVGLLLAVALWDVGYGAELLATDADWRVAFGDVKYVGIAALTPTWIAFILCWTGRGARVSRRLVLALAVEPVLLLLVLALPQTHDLVRSLPDGAADPLTAEIATGPLFWVHVVYVDGLLLPATAVFVGSLLRRSRAYWLEAFALGLAALLPWVANLLFTLSVGPFGALDLTPAAFTVTGGVLVWGLLSPRLLRLAPQARAALVDRMTDGVVVLDAYGHVSDANPAARRVLGDRLLGAPAADVVPPQVLTGGQVDLPVDGGSRSYEVTAVDLPGRRGEQAGRLLVLRDVTERAQLEQRLRALLAEQHRVAAQLSSSLRPVALPQVPGLGLAARFRPAGDGTEIGGDFYDVVAVGEEWAFALGDVSGKGARAAATTASARYTLRTLVLAGARPAQALQRLHALLAGDLDDETYLTVVHGRVRPDADGVAVTLALGGHPQPLLVRPSGEVRAVGVPGSAIGLLDDVEVTETTLHLAPGEALVLFSDGVSEARRGPELFGEAGLAEALGRLAGSGCDGLAAGVLAEVLALPGGTPSDDIALLVLEAPVRPVVLTPRPAEASVRSG